MSDRGLALPSDFVSFGVLAWLFRLKTDPTSRSPAKTPTQNVLSEESRVWELILRRLVMSWLCLSSSSMLEVDLEISLSCLCLGLFSFVDESLMISSMRPQSFTSLDATTNRTMLTSTLKATRLLMWTKEQEKLSVISHIQSISFDQSCHYQFPTYIYFHFRDLDTIFWHLKFKLREVILNTSKQPSDRLTTRCVKGCQMNDGRHFTIKLC